MTGAPRVMIDSRAREAMIRAAAQALPVETGGILLGYRSGKEIVVTDLLVVPNPSATPQRYTRDDVRANELLIEWFAGHPEDPLTGYVGEWHSHTGIGPASGLDLKSAAATARRARGPIALLVCAPKPLLWLDAFVLRKARFRRVSAQRVSLEVQDEPVDIQDALPEGAVRSDGPVFISYRQSDGWERATQIEHLLRAAGLVLWRDRNDLRAGNTRDRLDEALTGGLSGAVLVVTEDIKHSDIVRNNELPRLLQLDERPEFSLCIANEVPNPNDVDRPDYHAPDRLLARSDAVLSDKKQSNSRTEAGRLEIVRDLLMHRIELRRHSIRERGGVLTVLTQTRPETFAGDAAADADLHVRLRPADRGRLPSAAGLADLKQTLPLVADAVFTAGVRVVRLSGGMHLSVALAIGAALPETRLGSIEVVDSRENIWSSEAGASDPKIHVTTLVPVETIRPPKEGTRARIATFVTLTPNADEAAFRRLLAEAPRGFSSAVRIAVEPGTLLDAAEAARIAADVAGHIKRLSAEQDRAEVHLAFQGPYGIAVLVGRLLNTLRLVAYEWDDEEERGPAYHPVVTLSPGVVGGPITGVLV
ncbi:MAG: SAVED domain-containing protein [Dehalococcoidia bacterium]|nr:SAVED domain-containing protein [Dehalococcoidia bacterium]